MLFFWAAARLRQQAIDAFFGAIFPKSSILISG
jgi:hypothetical protein